MTGPGDRGVRDSHPRVVSNLVVDQTVNNPAAVAAAGADPEIDGPATLKIDNRKISTINSVVSAST